MDFNSLRWFGFCLGFFMLRTKIIVGETSLFHIKPIPTSFLHSVVMIGEPGSGLGLHLCQVLYEQGAERLLVWIQF